MFENFHVFPHISIYFPAACDSWRLTFLGSAASAGNDALVYADADSEAHVAALSPGCPIGKWVYNFNNYGALLNIYGNIVNMVSDSITSITILPYITSIVLMAAIYGNINLYISIRIWFIYVYFNQLTTGGAPPVWMEVFDAANNG